MEKTRNMPMWVYLVYASIEARRTALWIIYASVLFTLYCIPWASLSQAPAWVKTLFLLDDWTWFLTMVPMTIWYWLAFRWADNNAAWTPAGKAP